MEIRSVRLDSTPGLDCCFNDPSQKPALLIEWLIDSRNRVLGCNHYGEQCRDLIEMSQRLPGLVR